MTSINYQLLSSNITANTEAYQKCVDEINDWATGNTINLCLTKATAGMPVLNYLASQIADWFNSIPDFLSCHDLQKICTTSLDVKAEFVVAAIDFFTINIDENVCTFGRNVLHNQLKICKYVLESELPNSILKLAEQTLQPSFLSEIACHFGNDKLCSTDVITKIITNLHQQEYRELAYLILNSKNAYIFVDMLPKTFCLLPCAFDVFKLITKQQIVQSLHRGYALEWIQALSKSSKLCKTNCHMQNIFDAIVDVINVRLTSNETLDTLIPLLSLAKKKLFSIDPEEQGVLQQWLLSALEEQIYYQLQDETFNFDVLKALFEVITFDPVELHASFYSDIGITTFAKTPQGVVVVTRDEVIVLNYIGQKYLQKRIILNDLKVNAIATQANTLVVSGEKRGNYFLRIYDLVHFHLNNERKINTKICLLKCVHEYCFCLNAKQKVFLITLNNGAIARVLREQQDEELVSQQYQANYYKNTIVELTDKSCVIWKYISGNYFTYEEQEKKTKFILPLKEGKYIFVTQQGNVLKGTFSNAQTKLNIGLKSSAVVSSAIVYSASYLIIGTTMGRLYLINLTTFQVEYTTEAPAPIVQLQQRLGVLYVQTTIGINSFQFNPTKPIKFVKTLLGLAEKDENLLKVMALNIKVIDDLKVENESLLCLIASFYEKTTRLPPKYLRNFTDDTISNILKASNVSPVFVNMSIVRLFKKHKQKKKSIYKCTICQSSKVNEKNTISILPCGHHFHTGCIDKLISTLASRNEELLNEYALSTTLQCPLCRVEFTPKDARESDELTLSLYNDFSDDDDED